MSTHDTGPEFEMVHQSNGLSFEHRQIDAGWEEYRFYNREGEMVRHTAIPRVPIISAEAIAELDRQILAEEE